MRKIEGAKHEAIKYRADRTEEIKEVYYREYKGQYPVIYLNFKNITDLKNLKELNLKERNSISGAYKMHAYLHKKELITLIKNYKKSKPEFPRNNEDIENSNISSLNPRILHNNIDLYLTLKRLKAYYNTENIIEAPLIESASFLCKNLRENYDKKLLVLIDEYD